MKLTLKRADITLLTVDAIVNAANGFLEGGGGVDGAIHRKAGPELKEACIALKREMGINFLPTGKAVITPAFNLPSKYVIHTVGPIYNPRDTKQAEQLRQCYFNSLNMADAYECHTIAFPNISTGVYRYPKEDAASIAIQSVKAFRPKNIEEVLFVCFDQENYNIYNAMLNG